MAKILVCDDNPLFLKVMSGSLKDMGFGVQCYEKSDDFIAELTQQFYDIAIIDMIMPHGGGVQLTHRTKAASPDTKIVVCTGQAELLSSPIMEVGMRSADAKISKDIDPGELQILLEDLISPAASAET
ncbi:hypothetical protein BVC71_12775 [Marivivens niveibacter]|uniref:Response regulatory domain-containing protein n=1 Tax=Marivivens niveibacter TaxID=1930667 RepID=A0A251WV63_9RHOB|nr:response regulator [Marivivens niveibacter]OUD08380.1 hypothetical protein BVC71_12775 [Marivivens niveibacter]